MVSTKWLEPPWIYGDDCFDHDNKYLRCLFYLGSTIDFVDLNMVIYHVSHRVNMGYDHDKLKLRLKIIK